MKKMRKFLFYGIVCSMIVISCSTQDEATISPAINDEQGVKAGNATESQAAVNDDSAVKTSSSTLPDRYIVELRESDFSRSSGAGLGMSRDMYEASIASKRQSISRNIGKLGIRANALDKVYGFAFNGFSAKLTILEVERLRNNPLVASIREDVEIKLNLPMAKETSQAGQVTPWGISRVGGFANGTGKTAYIIDTGIDLDHPDLNVNVNKSRSFVPGDRNPNDGVGHGTHVAGTVGALNNDIGVVGVAAGASLVSLKVFDNEGSGYVSWSLEALDYVAAVAKSGEAVNLSLGSSVNEDFDNAVKSVGEAGIRVAIAAGNDYEDVVDNQSPARANGTNVFTVSSISPGDFFSRFSNWGSPVDYAAPGDGVESTYLNGGYTTLSGTSMASPHLCGLLLFDAIPSSDGYAIDGYWEIVCRRLLCFYTGDVSANSNEFEDYIYKPDPDGIPDPIASF